MFLKHVWLTLGLLCSSAHATTPVELTLSVGQWPPYLDENLPHQGVVAHLISDLLADEGYRVSFHPSSSGHDYAAWCEALIHGMRDFTGLRRQ